MGRILYRKGERGIATSFISRKQALKKLQLSLKDFRRLCILKGIYPVEPPNKRKANKNSSTNKTYYYLKDIQFLAHEPLINKFRAFRIFIRRLNKAIGKHDQDASQRLRNNQPIFKLDHIVKERYPTFIDALRDADDAISTCFLFSTFPKSRNVKVELIQLCRRLTVEFLHYVVQTRSLRKVFLSIKGIYYQAEIMGQLITWVVPHTFGYCRPTDVDFKIMVTFAQFYSTMLGFVNYKLYHSINLNYPPKLIASTSNELLKGEDDNTEYIAALNLSLKTTMPNNPEDEEIDDFPELSNDDDIQERKSKEDALKKQKNLFSDCKIFLNREVPKESLLFIIRCFGGEVSFDKSISLGATFDETDQTITHQICDRPLGTQQYLNRYYVQPQWIYDSVNAKVLLPVELYFPGEDLPPHLSPFVEEKDGDYIPPEKQALLDFQKGLTQTLKRIEEASEDEKPEEEFSDEEKVDTEESDTDQQKKNPIKRKAENSVPNDKRAKMKVTQGVPLKEDPIKLAQKEAAEEKRLAIMAMSKKNKHLYQKIIYGQKRKNREVQKMKEKRDEYNKKQKSKKREAKSF